MTNWNPSAPTVVGMERAAATTTPFSLDARSIGAGQLIVSTVNETIVDMGVPLTCTGTRQLVYEIFDLSALAMTNIASVTNDNETAVREPPGNPPAIPGGYTSSNSIVNDGSTATGRMRFDSTFQAVRCTFDFSAIPSGKRIVRVDVSFGVYGLGGFYNVYWRDMSDPGLNVTMLNGLRGVSSNPLTYDLGVKWSGELCPWTGQPWTRDDLTAMHDPGGSTEAKCIWIVYGREQGSTWLKYVDVTVVYADDNRLAYGAQLLTPQSTANFVPLYHGADTRIANYAKTSATIYLLASVRRAWQSPQIDGGNTSAYGSTALLPTLGVSGGITNIGDAGGALTHVTGLQSLGAQILPVILRRSGGVGSVNSVPYAPTSSLVDDVNLSWQNFVAPNTGTYSLITIACAPVDVGTSTLTVTVKNHGTGATLATGTLTAAQVLTGSAVGSEAIGTSTVLFRLGRVIVTPFVLTLGMSVDIFVARSGALPLSTSAVQGWHVLVQTSVSKETGDWNGTWANGVGGWTAVPPFPKKSAASLTVAVAPNAPTGLGVSVELQTTDAGGWCGSFDAAVDGIDFVHVNWTTTALGTDFGYYEVQRSDPLSDWTTVSLITDESFSEFDDYEARVGIATAYRVRVARNDGAPSGWTTEIGTVTVTGKSAELLFTTNEAPLMNVAYYDDYPDDAPTRSYSFPESQEVTFVPMHGRDLAVAFHPSERRGVEFTRELLINGLAAVAAAGPPVVDPIRDLAWAPLAYVCVRDTNGNRWLAALVVAGADSIERRNIYHASVYVREVATIPSTPNAPGVVATEAIAELWP